MEWGTKAYDIMWRLKELFDPEYVLNPGVVLNKVRARHACSLSPWTAPVDASSVSIPKNSRQWRFAQSKLLPIGAATIPFIIQLQN